MYGKLTGDPHNGSCIWLEVSTALWVEKEAGGEGALARLLSKCENLHFYLLIYLTDRALKQPSINKRRVGNE